MRIGFNPYKDKILENSVYCHQVIVPVYIPNHDGYFKDSLSILKLCLQSLLETVHNRTFITIVNNGSDIVVKNYLDSLFKENKIHELIHTNNIGKLNSILKGLTGNNIEIVTISDSDVLFLNNWQKETINVFRSLPKVGVVGIVPQFKMYEINCGTILFDTIFSSKLQFFPVKNKDALIRFYDSIGWARDYNQDYLNYNLGLKISKNENVLLGSGHFVSTYKKDIFEKIKTYIEFKMGGSSEDYLDRAPLEKGYWRVTTSDNYAYHMGNTLENWMSVPISENINSENLATNFPKNKKQNKFLFFIKNRAFVKLLFLKQIKKLFLRYKKLPQSMIENY